MFELRGKSREGGLGAAVLLHASTVRLARGKANREVRGRHSRISKCASIVGAAHCVRSVAAGA